MGKGESLTGNYWVRVFRPAWREASKWLPRTKDRIDLRSHALKLRFWPEAEPEDETGQVLDVNWSWIRALKGGGHKIGELRIDDAIGGHDNLRVIFYLADAHPNGKNPMKIIWILAVLQKKRQDFTQAQMDVYKGRKTLVDERFYTNRMFD